MREGQVVVDVHLGESGTLAGMGREIRDGLTNSPKYLPSKYFYDERGSGLFEEITELPEYYLTRAERSLIDGSAGSLARMTLFADLVELGAGSARKTRPLIEAGLDVGSLTRYLPVDVSLEMAEQTAGIVARQYPGLEVHAVVGDFERHLGRLPEGGRRMVAFLGSTLGNFPDDEAVGILAGAADMLGEDGWLLLGTDLVKDEARLVAAYNDEQGVTAEFNANILRVINRHLGGDFDPEAFEHVSFFNAEASRIETYLRSRTRQSVRLAEIELEVSFEAGELVRTEISCKYTRESLERLLERADLEMTHWFTGDREEYALSLSRRG